MNSSLPCTLCHSLQSCCIYIHTTHVLLLPSWTPGSVSFFSVVFVFLIPLLLVLILFLHRSQFLLLYLVSKHHLTQRHHRDLIKVAFKTKKIYCFRLKYLFFEQKVLLNPKHFCNISNNLHCLCFCTTLTTHPQSCNEILPAAV